MLDEKFRAYLRTEPTVSLRENLPLSAMTSMQVGGNADTVLTPRDTGAFIRLLDTLCANNMDFRVIGNGTNLIAPDEGYRGILIFCGGMDRLSVFGTSLRAGCGVSLSRAANAARQAGLTGLEEMYGIPGTVGGGLYMNAGAYGRNLSDTLCSATVYHPETQEISVRRPSQLAFSYRSSRLMREKSIVLSASFRLERNNSSAIAAKMREILHKRNSTQPLDYPSAGSIFRRPSDGVSAAALIEAAGLKGRQIGGAQVSEKHAGFLINRGGATASDIRRLIDEIKEKVLASSGVELVCEVEFL